MVITAFQSNRLSKIYFGQPFSWGFLVSLMHPPNFALIRPLQVLEQTDCFFWLPWNTLLEDFPDQVQVQVTTADLSDSIHFSPINRHFLESSKKISLRNYWRVHRQIIYCVANHAIESTSESTKVVTDPKSSKPAKVKTTFKATEFLGKIVKFVPWN